MPNIMYCIFCSSLEVAEQYNPTRRQYEYTCYECKEIWADDESELEVGFES
jgi:hypothetical protein